MSALDIIIKYYPAFLGGLCVTLKMCAFIWSTGLVVGMVLGALAANRARSWGRFTNMGAAVFSAVPTLVLLFWLHYPAQAVLHMNINPFYTACLALALINIFGVAEQVRHAVADFPAQYTVAGKVCGLNPHNIFIHIQLPILFRQLLPTLMVLQVGMLHATLFSSLISVEEIFRTAQRINSTIYRPIEIYTALAMFFLAVCMPINLAAAYLKKHYTRSISEK